jgi:hypothetical protein
MYSSFSYITFTPYDRSLRVYKARFRFRGSSSVIFTICLYCHRHHHCLRCAPQTYIGSARVSPPMRCMYTAVLRYMLRLRELKLGVRRRCIASIRSPRVYCNCKYSTNTRTILQWLVYSKGAVHYFGSNNDRTPSQVDPERKKAVGHSHACACFAPLRLCKLIWGSQGIIGFSASLYSTPTG